MMTTREEAASCPRTGNLYPESNRHKLADAAHASGAAGGAAGIGKDYRGG
jgi:hypothetical protein